MVSTIDKNTPCGIMVNRLFDVRFGFWLIEFFRQCYYVGKGPMKCLKILKIALLRGYVLIAISALCFVLTAGIWLLYGEPKTITTDPDYSLGTKGVTRYMPIEKYERYDFWWGLFVKIGFISGLTGAILCLWAHRPN